ncbi:hypothetical protein [Aeoliella sp.]|uniref:hypothetical protein n=1 Tax=Aeoliella sp. TaxID=2795800 RepID=UPI003CCC0FEE
MASKKAWFRFGIGTLLFLTACVAGYFTGYRYGVEEKQQQIRRTTVVTTTYNVGDLLSFDKDASVASADFDSLIDLIVSTVNSEKWVENGGPVNEIRPFPGHKSLVITCDLETHDQTADLLEQLRRGAYELDTEDLMAAVRDASARKQATPHAVKLYSALNPDVHRIVSGHYDSGLEVLKKRLGRPEATYTLDTEDFPTWIAAQKVAVWKKGDGKLYLALQDVMPEGEAVVVGWHEAGMDTIRPLNYTPAVAEATGR